MAKYELSDGKGNIIETRDDRSLQEAKKERLGTLKINARRKIEAVYPNYMQMNLANGIYDERRSTAMKKDLRTLIANVHALEDKISEAKTNEDVDNIDISEFDLTEEQFNTLVKNGGM